MTNSAAVLDRELEELATKTQGGVKILLDIDRVLSQEQVTQLENVS